MGPMACTNAALGDILGLTSSTVSRMRSGARTGSIETLIKVAEASDTPVEVVVAAAADARAGDPDEWVAILEGIKCEEAEA